MGGRAERVFHGGACSSCAGFAVADTDSIRYATFAVQQEAALVLEYLGRFEEADGHELVRYLTAAYFKAVTWEIVPGTTYERAVLREMDTSAPEYRAFEKQIYETALERMGFQKLLSRQPDRARAANTSRKNDCKRGDAR